MNKQEERVTHFDRGTPEKVQAVLTELCHSGRRIRVYCGDPDTGAAWQEEFGVTGYVGRSTGTSPIMLLVPNARSLGGPALSTARILKIVETRNGAVLYQHPKYHGPKYTAANGSAEAGYLAEVYVTQDGKRELYANCKTLQQAVRLAAFMNGERNAK